MTSEARKLREDDLTTSNVVPFPNMRGNSSFSASEVGGSAILEKLMSDPAFEDHLKEIIEGTVYSFLANEVSENLTENDDPFDSIYIANLEADGIKLGKISILANLANKIEDRSGDLIIEDGLDD